MKVLFGSLFFIIALLIAMVFIVRAEIKATEKNWKNK